MTHDLGVKKKNPKKVLATVMKRMAAYRAEENIKNNSNYSVAMISTTRDKIAKKKKHHQQQQQQKENTRWRSSENRVYIAGRVPVTPHTLTERARERGHRRTCTVHDVRLLARLH